MASSRDPSKYIYISNISLEKASWTTQKFQDDMQDHHQTETPGKFAASVIGEYYKLLAKLDQHGIVFVGNATVGTVGAANNNGSNGHSSNGNGRRSKAAAVEEPEPEDQSNGDDGGMGDIANFWSSM